ncbi:MAG: hypothetical protein IPN17_04495 [Deltaproteobacteria bacterium]|jgi:hypothetical protein|nr:hypothetical protein [Deltaproteobacteria bacterium]MBK7064717.1 hypothetical protein [Deltaproteobacteria bacterium]MBK8691567.1 hypothetical protein [Deltaproteobacteria bacterium]
MRARRTHVANRDDYDSFDLPPPEVFDAPPEPPVDEAPTESAMASGPSLTAPVQVCLVCGDDPSIESGCGHFEVATVTALSASMLHSLAALRAQHESLRDELRTLRRLTGAGVVAGDATIEVREPPVVAPRVVLIPPPTTKRPRRAAPAVTEQGRFGFVEPVVEVVEEAAPGFIPTQPG